MRDQPEQARRQLDLFDPARIGLGRLAPVAEGLEDLAASEALTLGEAVAYVVERGGAGGRLAPSSLDTFARTWRGFARYASRARGVDLLHQVDRSIVVGYLETTTRSGREPSVATTHLRRAALRCLFAILRDAGLMATDPTCDLRLPTRTPRPFRPLNDEEVERCRAASQATLLETREPTVWALAEVGASGHEIGHVAPWDVTGRAVILAGGPKTAPRQVSLTYWGQRAVHRRLEYLAGGPWLVSAAESASAHSRRTSALEALRRTIQRAGVAGREVEPRSVTAWAGLEIYRETGRIEDVARGLGIPSLDQAAALIRLDWTDA